jgi:hypothetical protein
MNKEEMLEKVTNKALIGSKISILMAQRTYLKEKLDNLSGSRYFNSAEVNFDFLNEIGSTSSCKSFYKAQRKYSTDSQKLGEEICDELNGLETKLVAELLDISKTHLELKIEAIDNVLNRLGNEKDNSRSG